MKPNEAAVIDSVPGWQIISEALSSWLVLGIILFVVLYGYARGVKVYEVFVEGAKEGFQTAVTIIPYLVAIFMAIALFQASGTMDLIGRLAKFVVNPDVFPPNVIMMSLMKPLSGSGARALMLEVFSSDGVDSYSGFLASAINGSTETTFYVIAVYFGSVGVKKARHTVAVGLLAETVAVVVAVAACWVWWQSAHPAGQ